jgi:hypothetical protein
LPAPEELAVGCFLRFEPGEKTAPVDAPPTDDLIGGEPPLFIDTPTIRAAVKTSIVSSIGRKLKFNCRE